MTTQIQERPAKLDIPMEPVQSSQIATVGYSPEHQMLALTFTRGPGHTYHHPGFTPTDYAAFRGAESLGSHFIKHIKNRPFHKYEKN